MSAKKESIISRVQKLLNLAMDSGATEDERKLAQERADRLMVEHMIEQSELKKDDPNRSRVTHEVWTISMDPDFKRQIDTLLSVVISHAQCRSAVRYKTGSAQPNGFREYLVTIVGTPEAISYAERLWFITFTEMARNMFPAWDNSIPFDTNVYNFVKAGFKWRNIHEIAWSHNVGSSVLPDPYPADKQSQYGSEKVYGGDGGRLKRAFAREQKRLGEEVQHHTSRHSAYRQSYVQSYVATIQRRLREMAHKSKRVCKRL